MANTAEQLQNLVLSAQELQSLNPKWSGRMIEDYLTLFSDLLLLANTNDINAAQVAQNTLDIATNTTNIATNTTDIGTNTTNIGTNTSNIGANTTSIAANTTNIGTNTTNLSNHISADAAHGSTGDIVGTGDFCTEILGGVVLLSPLVNDAIASAVSVTSPNATAAPATYDQTQAQTVVTLANEMKGDVNTLVADLNNAIAQINDFIAQNKAANQMNTI